VNFLFTGVSLKNKRQSNMDSLILKRGLIGEKDALLAVVCDGVGSLLDGAYASGTSVRMLNEWFDSVTTIERVGLRMRDAVLEINAHIISEGKQKNIDTASTLSALLIIENDYYIVHIGDSRVYIYEDGSLTVLTSDDVSDSGKLSAYIGQNENIFPQYYEGTAVGKIFLVCSDGLYKRMDIGFMAAKLKNWNKRSLQKPVDSLTQYVIERGEQDNISIALVRIES